MPKVGKQGRSEDGDCTGRELLAVSLNLKSRDRRLVEGFAEIVPFPCESFVLGVDLSLLVGFDDVEASKSTSAYFIFVSTSSFSISPISSSSFVFSSCTSL